MTERIRWGVMGNATIARVCVIPAIQRSHNGRVRTLATRSPEQAVEIASRCDVQRVVREYDALLEDPEIDAVYIPLPNHLHHSWTIKALQAGKHVLCEKPLACTAREAQHMADTAADAGLFLMEAFMYRFHPRMQRIRRMVADGAIGTPRLVRSAFCFHMSSELLARGDNIRLQADRGGGALMDVGCYSVSVARWLFDQEPTHLQAQAIYHPGGVDVHFVGSLRFPGGQLATLEASFLSALQQTFTIVGSEAAIELPHNAFIPWEKDAIFTLRGQKEEVGTEYVIPGADQYQLMVEHFADVVLGKMPPLFTPRESVLNMRALDALAEAARAGKTVAL
jgi:xylose dehydrogenase (NAD/NADP)